MLLILIINQILKNVNMIIVKNLQQNDYCQNHKFKCKRKNCNIRILTENYYCSNHRKY